MVARVPNIIDIKRESLITKFNIKNTVLTSGVKLEMLRRRRFQ